MIKRSISLIILSIYFCLTMSAFAKDNSSNIHFICPVDSGKIISTFGKRYHPVYKIMKRHNGIDIKANSGANVYSTAQGRISFSGNKKGYGKSIIIEHAEGYSTFYAHLEKIFVKEGQSVKTGKVIGLIGSTGISTVPHLHYELRKNNIAINPESYLNCFKKVKKENSR